MKYEADMFKLNIKRCVHILEAHKIDVLFQVKF